VATTQQILAGRNRVDAYRTAHVALYNQPWHKGIPEAHTPLLNAMVNALNGLGFNSIQEFFDASDLLNLQELGFIDMEDFEQRATNADRAALDGMWH